MGSPPLHDRPPAPRSSVRRTVRYPARIDCGNGSPPRDCTILNISAMGARLIVGNQNDIPEEFTLLFGVGGRRRCFVGWRSHGEIDVQFLSEPPRSDPEEKFVLDI